METFSYEAQSNMEWFVGFRKIGSNSAHTRHAYVEAKKISVKIIVFAVLKKAQNSLLFRWSRRYFKADYAWLELQMSAYTPFEIERQGFIDSLIL